MLPGIRLFLFPAIVIALVAAVLAGGGLGVAQDTTGSPVCPGETPASPEADEASPEPGTIGSPVASPVGSPVADACPATPSADGGGNEYTIEMVDIAFIPDELTIPADTDVTIILPNNGVALHNFNIDELDIHSEDAAGGETLTVTINAPAGEYIYYCDIPGHRASGMVGTLIVE